MPSLGLIVDGTFRVNWGTDQTTGGFFMGIKMKPWCENIGALTLKTTVYEIQFSFCCIINLCIFFLTFTKMFFNRLVTKGFYVVAAILHPFPLLHIFTAEHQSIWDKNNHVAYLKVLCRFHFFARLIAPSIGSTVRFFAVQSQDQ